MAGDFRLAYFPDQHLAATGGTGYLARILSQVLGQAPERLAGLADVPSGAILVHLAASVDHASAGTLETNFELDVGAVRAVNERLGGLIYASTNNVYSLGTGKALDDPLTPTDAYGASKRVGEVIVRSLCRRPWAIMRIADVFGPGQRHGNFFRALETAIRERQPVRIFGAGAKLRSYIYAYEMASILLHYAELLRSGTGEGTISNVCYPDALTVREIAGEVSRLAGLEITEVELKDDRSREDVRTMIPGPWNGYRLQWSMNDALRDYVRRCGSGEGV